MSINTRLAPLELTRACWGDENTKRPADLATAVHTVERSMKFLTDDERRRLLDYEARLDVDEPAQEAS